MNLNEALKTRSLQIRNITFFVLLAGELLAARGRFGVFWSSGIPYIPVALAGLMVVLLTIRLNKESILQKCFFVAAGGAGTGLAIFNIMFRLGWDRVIILSMIDICQPLFFIGAVGCIVCLVRGSTAKDPIAMKRAKLAWTRWLAWALWAIGPVVFIICLLTDLSNYFPYKPVMSKSGFVQHCPNVLDVVLQFCNGGGWLIPLPFVIAAIIVTAISKLGDRTKVQRVLKMVLWVIVLVGSALALLFLMAITRCAPW